MREFIEKFKTTYFYCSFVSKLYVSTETPDVLWVEYKAPFTKKDEIALWEELSESDIVIMDADQAYLETDNGVHWYSLQEIK